MAIKLVTTTKDKKNLLGRRVVEKKTSGVGGTSTSRDVYNRKGDLIKSKSISNSNGMTTKTKTNAMSNTTKSVSKPTSSSRGTMLENRVNRAISKKYNQK